MKLTRRESKRIDIVASEHSQRLSRTSAIIGFRSHHIYAQVIDDTQHHTLVAASTLEPGLKSLQPVVTAKLRLSWKLIAQRLLEKVYQRLCLTVVVTYHGRESTSRQHAKLG